MAHLPHSDGLLVDPHDERFQVGKDDAFQDWWAEREYSPRATDEEYARGYAFGWELASDPLHEDGYDPQLGRDAVRPASREPDQ